MADLAPDMADLPPDHELNAENSGGLYSEGSYEQAMAEQRFYVPLKMRSANARDAVELLLRLSDNDPVTVMASVAEMLSQKNRARFANAEVLLRRVSQLRASDAGALQGARRAKRVAPPSPYGQGGRPPRSATAPQGAGRPPLSASGANVPAAERAALSGRVGGTNELASVMPELSGEGSVGSYPPPHAKPRTAPAGRRPNGGPASGFVQLPPLEPSAVADSAAWNKGDQHMKQWLQEKKLKEKVRSHQVAKRANQDRRWLAQLAEKQNARNRQRKLDEERHGAASKIQGLYRGHADRKMMKTIRKQREDAEAARKAAQDTDEGRLDADIKRLFG